MPPVNHSGPAPNFDALMASSFVRDQLKWKENPLIDKLLASVGDQSGNLLGIGTQAEYDFIYDPAVARRKASVLREVFE